jgi:hypothetical protein
MDKTVEIMVEDQDKFITTRSLEWFGAVKSRFWVWLFDEGRDYKRLNFIVGIILGAIVVRLVPRAFEYVGIAAGALLILAFAVGCLIPIAYLVEWALRRWVSF